MKHRLPHIFIVAGMPRSGTTFLYHNFQKHPAIYTPPIKETGYFSYNFTRGPGWFNNLFRDMALDQIGCDISPLYFLDTSAIDRISSLYSNVKIILAIRDPVEFAVSFYHQCKSFLWNVPPFEEFIEYYRFRKGKGNVSFQLTGNSCISLLNIFRNAFGDRLLFYNFEFFKRDPLAVLQMIESFVGVPSYFDEHNFDRSIINPSGRNNTRLIRYLSNNQTFILLFHKLVPSQLFTFIRQTFYRLSLKEPAQEQKDQSRNLYDVAERAFSSDRSHMRALFREHDVLLGTGAPFRASDTESVALSEG